MTGGGLEHTLYISRKKEEERDMTPAEEGAAGGAGCFCPSL